MHVLVQLVSSCTCGWSRNRSAQLHAACSSVPRPAACRMHTPCTGVQRRAACCMQQKLLRGVHNVFEPLLQQAYKHGPSQGGFTLPLHSLSPFTLPSRCPPPRKQHHFVTCTHAKAHSCIHALTHTHQGAHVQTHLLWQAPTYTHAQPHTTNTRALAADLQTQLPQPSETLTRLASHPVPSLIPEHPSLWPHFYDDGPVLRRIRRALAQALHIPPQVCGRPAAQQSNARV